MNPFFFSLESEMALRPFLIANPVLAASANAPVVGNALVQYCRLPEVIVSLLLAARAHFPQKSGVARELARNVAQESGRGTAGIPHVEILKLGLSRDLGIDASNVHGSVATETFIAALREGMSRNASFALGQTFALEASAVPELAYVVGPAINAYARSLRYSPPIVAEALKEDGTYPLPTLRTKAKARAMPMSAWFALHVRDFEVGHRDLLRVHAKTFLERDGDAEQFRAGFINVLDLMDAWWTALAEA